MRKGKKIIVRPYEPEDEGNLKKIVEAVAVQDGLMGLERPSPKYGTTYGPHHSFVAEGESGEAIGYAAAFPVPKTDNHALHFAVHPDHRGRRISERMIRQAVAQAFSAGATRIICTLTKHLPAGERALEKNNFRVAERDGKIVVYEKLRR